MTPQTIETRTTPADTAALVDALGLAWAAFTLYEDPSRVDSFERAVATLGRCPAYPYDYLVGADGFLDGETLVPHRREATVRVARRLFGLGASGLQLQGPPSADDLLHLFRLIAVGDSTEPTKDLRAAGTEAAPAGLRLRGPPAMRREVGARGRRSESPDSPNRPLGSARTVHSQSRSRDFGRT